MTDPADIPHPLPWEERTNSVSLMPGGYRGYVDSLHETCGFVSSQHPTVPDLDYWLQDQYELTEKSASEKTGFMLRAGVLESDSDQLDLSAIGSRWYEAEDDGILIALLHSRTRFFGEMLAELSEQPRSEEELRRGASRYQLSWKTLTQVNYRRGWLESAKLIAPTSDGRLAITDTGRDLLAKLTVHPPNFDSTGPTTPRPLPIERRGGSDYRSPARQETVERRRVFEVDPDIVDRGTAAHMDVQDQLAEAVRSAGVEPRSPAPHDPQFDVAWQINESAFVAEVKSVTEENEDRQLRLGLGQVLCYAFLLDWPGVNDVQPVLAVERPPTDEYWGELCKEHGVILTWPDDFQEFFN